MMDVFLYFARPVRRIVLLAIGWPLAVLVGLPASFATMAAFLTAGMMLFNGHQDIAWKFLFPGVVAAAVTAVAFWPAAWPSGCDGSSRRVGYDAAWSARRHQY